MIKRSLILRKEKKGGILFIPENAVRLELDEEATFFIEHFYLHQKPAQTKEEHEIIKILLHHKALYYQENQFQSRHLRVVPHAFGPTLIDFQITNQCFQNCPQCYASSHPQGEHLLFSDFQKALLMAKESGVFQVALGGGEPLLHPQLEEIIDFINFHGMLPNITTAYHALETKIPLLKKCGAIALSLENIHDDFSYTRKYGFPKFQQNVEMITQNKIPLTIHITLSKSNVKNLRSIVDYCSTLKDVYGVIFLAYKPVGRGAFFDASLNEIPMPFLIEELSYALEKLRQKMNVGYDCCLAPIIAQVEKKIYQEPTFLFEGCSGLSSSIAILPNLDICECSFTQNNPLGNLNTQNFLEIWKGKEAQKRRKEREKHKEKCSPCLWERTCQGGCPYWQLTPPCLY